jgi:hypothetical protein
MLFRGKSTSPFLTTSLANRVSSALTSGDYSDLTITCGGNIHKVYKLIVCTRADFFARAVNFGGKVCVSTDLVVPL